MSKTLFLMLGYPGAGKTTTAKIIKDLAGADYLSSDDLRVQMFENSDFSQSEHDALYKSLDSNLEAVLQAGKTVVYDANLNRLVHRQEKYEMAKKYDYRPVLIWVQAPRDIAKQRRIDEVTHHHLVPAHETPEQMFDRTADAFEAPADDEKYINLDGTQVNPEYVRNQLTAAHAL